jgi:hypothetical protein
MSPDQETTQQIGHVHRYEPKGRFMWWAECACGEKLNHRNGVVIGSRRKIERELAAL